MVSLIGCYDSIDRQSIREFCFRGKMCHSKADLCGIGFALCHCLQKRRGTLPTNITVEKF